MYTTKTAITEVTLLLTNDPCDVRSTHLRKKEDGKKGISCYVLSDALGCYSVTLCHVAVRDCVCVCVLQVHLCVHHCLLRVLVWARW